MHTRRPFVAWITVCVVWGTTYLGIRIALETFPPFLMAACRWLTAGSLLLIMLTARGEILPEKRTWFSIAWLSVLMITIGNGAVVWAEQTVPSGLTAVLIAATPFWMVAIERVMPGGEPWTLRRIAGLIVGFAGIVLLVWPELELGQGREFLAGVAATQFASLGWALGSSISKRRGREENVLAISALQMVFAGMSLLLLASMTGEWSRLGVNARTGAALVYLIVVGSLIGYSAYAYALKHLPVTTVSLYAYVNPVIAVILGTLVLGEPFSSRIVMASALVFVGILRVRQRH